MSTGGALRRVARLQCAATLRECLMLDIVYAAVGCLFFMLSVFYTAACDRL